MKLPRHPHSPTHQRHLQSLRTRETSSPKTPQRSETPPSQTETMTSQAADQLLGQAAYDAYCMQAGGRSLATGDDLPLWADLDSKFHDAWVAAARAVEALVREPS